MTDLINLQLNQIHSNQGARFGVFAGHSMPIHYSLGIKAEHLHTRKAVGLFDVSHMGQLIISGPGAGAAIEALVPAALQEMIPGQIRYTQFTLENGGVLDDLMITCWDTDRWGLVVNSACKFSDIVHLRKNLSNEIQLIHLEQQCLIAIQGPKARSTLAKLIPEAKTLPFMQAIETVWNDESISLSCCGYTGEDGFEISINSEAATDLAEDLKDLAETTWVGLGARNSLRLESGLCLYGSELDTSTTPIEANLLWSIQKRRRIEGGFLGAEVILNQICKGPSRKLVGIQPCDGRTVIREHTTLQNSDGTIIGRITSGGFGPSISSPIAVGYVELNFSSLNTTMFAVVRGKFIKCVVTHPNFIQQRYSRPIQ